jgi:hypothetical protein
MPRTIRPSLKEREAEAEKAKALAAAAAVKAARLKEAEERKYQALSDFVKDNFLALTSIEGQALFAGEHKVELNRSWLSPITPGCKPSSPARHCAPAASRREVSCRENRGVPQRTRDRADPFPAKTGPRGR